MIRSVMEVRYSLSLVAGRVVVGYALCGLVLARFEASYALTSSVATRLAVKSAILEYAPVAARFTSVHSMFDPQVEFVDMPTAMLDGQPIEIVACAISCNEDSYCLSCEAEVADAAAWSRCLPGAELDIALGSQTFSFLIDGRSRTRVFPAATFKITARSPASRLDAPYAQPFAAVWSNSTALTIAQEICDAAGIVLDWRVADWPLAAYAATGQTPLAVLDALKTQAAVLLSDNDGSLVVQYRFPISPPRYASVAPDLVFSDYDDVFQLEDTLEYRPCYNAVYVLDERKVTEQVVELQEWTGAPGSKTPEVFPPTQRCVAAFSYPSQPLVLQTSCPARVLVQGVQEFDHQETIEFVQGKGKLTYVLDQILSTSWLCANLGAVTVAGKQVASELVGQSLLAINYRVRYQRFLVECELSEKMQVWAENIESTLDSSPSLLRVERWPGDRAAPEVIVDPLCTTETSKRERGRNYLDEQSFFKERYEAATPPRRLVLPGSVAAVHDASLGASFSCKVTGWRYSAAMNQEQPEVGVVWDLERSLV